MFNGFPLQELQGLYRGLRLNHHNVEVSYPNMVFYSYVMHSKVSF